MPKFSESAAAKVDTSLPSNPIVSATDLCQHNYVIELVDKRIAKTEFGQAMFVDFAYCDDPYTPEGFRESYYTTVFSAQSPAYKQLEAMDLTYADPLECRVLAAGRSFKLGDADAPTEAPTSPQAAPSARPAQAPSRPAANAATPRPAPTGRPEARPAPAAQRPVRPTQQPITLTEDEADELPF